MTNVTAGNPAKKTVEKTFAITMNKEHLSQSLQTYLRTYGYLAGDDDYFDVSTVTFLKDGMVEVKGNVNNGP